MKRRDFVHRSGLLAGSVMASSRGWPLTGFGGSLTPVPTADRKALADIALEKARSLGASYTDVRIGRYLHQSLSARQTSIQNISDTESYGVGIRVIAKGAWGFGATNDVTPDGVARAAAEAVAVARASSALIVAPVQLAPEKAYGEVTWKTPIEQNAFDVPIGEKADLLKAANEAAMKNGADYSFAVLSLVNEQKYFASTDGSYIDQDIHRIFPYFNATAVNKTDGTFESRESLSSPRGMGYEYLSGRASGKVVGPVATTYSNYYDMIEDAGAAGREAKAKFGAKSVEAGTYDLVLDPSHLWLTIHESVGHPTELDRVLGYEANYAGTSFATLDKWRSGTFRYGSPLVNLFADRIQPTSLGAVGYDDEGVRTRRWDLVRNGILVDYQTIRDQVYILKKTQSDGCCFADSWSSIQFQRMPNVSLMPGSAPLTPVEMIQGVDKGIYIVGDGSWSIDQQRYNFQFGGILFYEIRGGRIAGQLKDVAYQSNSTEFWNSCVQICDRRDYRLGGSFSDGKGQPGQSSPVSHGSATARFNGITVINTAR